MDKLCSCKSIKKADEIPTSEIVELLASRYILYENASEETTYFLPSLLFPDHNVAKESNDPAILSGLFYSPILLCPSTEFCPLGLFPATVVNLSKREFWKLDKCNRFRNRIRFYVQYNKEKLLHVELRTLSTHLEFRILSTKPGQRSLDNTTSSRIVGCRYQSLVILSPHKKCQVVLWVLLSSCCELR